MTRYCVAILALLLPGALALTQDDGVHSSVPKTSSKASGGNFDLAARKAAHWAWQPIRAQIPPHVKDGAWPRDPLDCFVLARLEEKGLAPAARADKRVLIRRAYFDLIGLPPTPAEVEAFVADDSADAFAKVVDHLLASPHFGERWGRHWLDLVRYAETRGHEFDYDIPDAWHYRDYVIRALNADVPYDQFVIEHIAGDLLAHPRHDSTGTISESIIATGFWYMGEWLHSPVDIRQDECDRIDNQIDVFGKTFLGLTLGCARCHDHKFDAISAKDYYALAGFLESSSFRDVEFENQENNRNAAHRLRELERATTSKVLRTMFARAAGEPGVSPASLEHFAAPSSSAFDDERQKRATPADGIVVDYSHCDPHDWITNGLAFGDGPEPPRSIALGPNADHPIVVREHGMASSALAADHATGMLRTPTFTITAPRVWYLVSGSAHIFVEVDSHRLVQGPLHGQTKREVQTGEKWKWESQDLSAYIGQRAHVEFTPSDPAHPICVAVVRQGDPTNEVGQATITPLARMAEHPEDFGYDDAARERVATILADYQRQRKSIISESKPSAMTMAMLDANGVDEHLLIRGNPKTPGPIVPRRFLEAIAGPDQPPVTSGSGRLELAGRVVDRSDPLLPRVMLNRIWHHLMGRGIVASTDNFGVLGERPTNPELLDYLADRFVRDGWSIKKAIRAVMLSSTYQMASRSQSAGADQVDPQNLLLHRANIRRLEGEAIRDEMLALSGRFDARLFGSSVEVSLTPFMEGRGRPNPGGPLDGDGRRSIYLKIRRNFLSPMMLAFDTPAPFGTMGRRTVSNVPAQALILMNDPFVAEQAKHWARRVLAEAPPTMSQRIDRLYEMAFARLPSDDERRDAEEFLVRQAKELGISAGQPDEDETGLAHALMNVKEFIFVR